jgi:hypothetical protein
VSQERQPPILDPLPVQSSDLSAGGELQDFDRVAIDAGLQIAADTVPARSRHVVSIARTLAVWATRMARDQGAITDQEEWQCS